LRHFCCHCMRCWLPCGKRIITCAFFNCIQLLLLSWHCAHQRWNLHHSSCCHCQPNVIGCTSPILCNSKICCFWCYSSK
jgi:hypothetical protein